MMVDCVLILQPTGIILPRQLRQNKHLHLQQQRPFLVFKVVALL